MTIKPLPEGEEPNEPKQEPNWDALKLPEDDDGTARYGKTTFREQLLYTLKGCAAIINCMEDFPGLPVMKRIMLTRIERDIKELELRRDLHL